MTVEVVSVGTELLLGATIDSNAAEFGKWAADLGLDCYFRQTVGDNLGRVTDSLRLALSRADLVVTIGGLGPTQDDLTRDAIAAALGVPLILSQEVKNHIKSIFEKRNLRWVELNERQALIPEGGEPLKNAHGTAPGLWCPHAEKLIVALPGPPREFRPMLENEVAPRLQGRSGLVPLRSKVLRVTGLGESRVEELLYDLMQSEDPTLAPYAKTYEVHLRLSTKAATQEVAGPKLAALAKQIRERLGWLVFGEDDTSLEAAVLDRLDGKKLATAESLTGGMIASRLCGVPGASEVFCGGVVAYTPELKQKLLGVDGALIEAKSAICSEVAEQMALGAKQRLAADWAVGTTGVAGPGPDDRGNPAGLLYVGVAGPSAIRVEEYRLGGDRNSNRERAAQLALGLLYHELVGGNNG